MARLFVAARPPPEVCEALRGLDRLELPGVRWVPESQWHVTLRFLGDGDRRSAVEAVSGLRAPVASARLGPAVARLGERAVCLPVAGVDGLASAVADATSALGADPPDHPFRAHLTLGRLRDPSDDAPLVGTPWSARFEVDRVLLIDSRLGGGPAEHEVVLERRLG